MCIWYTSRKGALYKYTGRRRNTHWHGYYRANCCRMFGETANMLSKFVLVLMLIPLLAPAQADSSKWLRGFPITDYIVTLNDSVKVVQVELPEDMKISQKQFGVLYGRYDKSVEDAVQKGYGRCHLIKGNYYYFSIGNNTSGKELIAGDILYTYTEKIPLYFGLIPQLATHFIQLQDVHGKALYDRYAVFRAWSKLDEISLTDSLVADIQFTGQHFLENDPDADRLITKGTYKDKKVFYVMAECQTADLLPFLEYMAARPRLYAGSSWKISEIFATWLIEGAPMVVK